MPASDLASVVEENHRALDAFAKGDSEQLAALYSEHDDVSLANPFGPPVRGRDAMIATMQRPAMNSKDG